jgi:type IV secretory pathway VirB2 component (pilin)
MESPVKRLINSPYFMMGVMMLLIVVMPDISMAEGEKAPAAVTKAICAVIGALQGPIARGVAAFGIIFLGFSLFLGKISWGTGIALAIGLGAVFGAGEIVALIAPEGEGEPCKDGGA